MRNAQFVFPKDYLELNKFCFSNKVVLTNARQAVVRSLVVLCITTYLQNGSTKQFWMHVDGCPDK